MGFPICLLVLSASLTSSQEHESTRASNADRPADLKDRFVREYPVAAARLKAAVSSVHGVGRFRKREAGEREGNWNDLEFFRSGDMYRVHFRNLQNERHVNLGRSSREKAYLARPELSAIVCEPLTEYVWLERRDNKLSNAVRARLQLSFTRFINCLFAIDGDDLWQMVNDNKWRILDVKESSANPSWVDARFSFHYRHEKPGTDARGEALITFDPAHNWAIMQYHTKTLPPYDMAIYAQTLDLGELPDGGGFYPKGFRTAIFPKAAVPRSEPFDDTGWSEFLEFEVTELESRQLPDSVFTLEALGFGTPQWPRLYLVLFCAIPIVVLVAVRLTIRKIGRTAPTAG